MNLGGKYNILCTICFQIFIPFYFLPLHLNIGEKKIRIFFNIVKIDRRFGVFPVWKKVPTTNYQLLCSQGLFKNSSKLVTLVILLTWSSLHARVRINSHYLRITFNLSSIWYPAPRLCVQSSKLFFVYNLDELNRELPRRNWQKKALWQPRARHC